LVASELEKTIVPKLVKNKATRLLLRLLEIALDYKRNDVSNLYLLSSLMGEYWLNELLNKRDKEIAELCAIEAASIAICKMKDIIKWDKYRFSVAMIPTIEDQPQTDFSNNYEALLVRFVRNMFQVSNPESIKDTIKGLMDEEHVIFYRIAVHTINYHCDELKYLLWESKENPFDKQGVKHEFYQLLKNRCSSFSQAQIKKVLDWIETKDYYVSPQLEERGQREEALAYRKKEWLSSILETKDPEVLSIYQKYNAIAPHEIEHPGFDFWSETRWGRAQPGINKEDLLKYSNSELAKYLNDYSKGKNEINFSKGDLADVFKDSVSAFPERFSTDLESFLEVESIYQNALIWGLYDAWRANKQFDWGQLLHFILKLIKSREFWNNKRGTENYNYRTEITGQIADLIKEGTRDDRHAFGNQFLSETEEILVILAANTIDDIDKNRGYIDLALNSPKGRIFSAMIIYSLRYARLRGSEEERWSNPVKKYFDEAINKPASPVELFVILGLYLPNLNYLDRSWLQNNINKIFMANDDRCWEAAFTGYLYSTKQVYKDLYDLLRQNGHYEKALHMAFKDKQCIRSLVGHICVGYIEEWEQLGVSDNLVYKLLELGRIEHINEIIDFFWMLNGKLTDKIQVKIKPLWEILIEELMRHEEVFDYKKAIAELSRWLSIVDTIDDQVFEWIKLSIKYSEPNYNFSFLMEYLLKHTSKTPEKVGKLFLYILECGDIPLYKKENIQGITRELYNKGQKEIADTICNSYMAKGVDFLKTIYAEHILDTTANY